MTKKTNLTFDGTGIVNNRGASKYWGVSFSGEMNRWFVSIPTGQKPGTNRSISKCLYFNGLRGTETIAAQISAVLYQYRGKPLDGKVHHIELNDGSIYSVDTRKNTITRNFKGSLGGEKITSVSDMKFNFGAGTVTTKGNVTVQGKLNLDSDDSFTSDEKLVIGSMIAMYAHDKMSPKAASLINKLSALMGE